MANFINKYNTTSAYDGDASARAALGSTVSLDAQKNELHYDGVNVEVKRPKVGDAVYVDGGAYTPDSSGNVPSGTAASNIKFIAGKTLDHTKMTAAGNVAVGVVGLVKGNKAYVLYNKMSGAVRWCSSDSADSLTSDEYTSVFNNGVAVDRAGREGSLQNVNAETLDYNLQNRTDWDGSISSGPGNGFYSPKAWYGASGGAPVTVTPSPEEYATYGHGREGYLRYLESRSLAYPSMSGYGKIILQDGKAQTKILQGVNDRLEVAYIPPAQFATHHSSTYGSFETNGFFNVNGLRFGDWFWPSTLIQMEVFAKVTYKLDTNIYNDPINRTLYKINGNSTSNLIALLDNKNYWLPTLQNRRKANHMSSIGPIGNNNSLYAGYHYALSCALLIIGED